MAQSAILKNKKEDTTERLIALFAKFMQSEKRIQHNINLLEKLL